MSTKTRASTEATPRPRTARNERNERNEKRLSGGAKRRPLQPLCNPIASTGLPMELRARALLDGSPATEATSL